MDAEIPAIRLSSYSQKPPVNGNTRRGATWRGAIRGRSLASASTHTVSDLLRFTVTSPTSVLLLSSYITVAPHLRRAGPPLEVGGCVTRRRRLSRWSIRRSAVAIYVHALRSAPNMHCCSEIAMVSSEVVACCQSICCQSPLRGPPTAISVPWKSTNSEAETKRQ